jgi:hypothetical protein
LIDIEARSEGLEPMKSYRFFFSYASETHRASGTHLDEFFNALCSRVALETGEQISDVGYRDQNRLTLSSFWGKDLVAALQRSRVLISVISPHYLRSDACGREVEFFLRRYQLLKQRGGCGQTHRIIPIFWMDKSTCNEFMHPNVDKFLHELQLTQAGMPANYPNTGLYRHYLLGQELSYNSLVDIAGTAIKSLSNLEELPALAGANDFNDLPSFFSKQITPAAPMVASGPRSTNVIYAVATRSEASASCVSDQTKYENKREQWRPFANESGATVELLTREGLNAAGQDHHSYNDLGLPENLTMRLKLAKGVNSPVLIVLDHASLPVPVIKKSLVDYDEVDFPNVGLVTAGGSESDDTLLNQTMPTKYGARRPNHLWTVPLDRSQYVQNVAEVVGGLRRLLQQTGLTAIHLPAAPLPGI